MTTLFETVKLVFFFLTIMMVFMLIQGQAFLHGETIKTLHIILAPAYLVLVGLLLAYIMALMIDHPDNSREQSNKLYIHMFLGGLVVGIILALIYIFAG